MMTKEEAATLYEKIAARQSARFEGYYKYVFTWGIECAEGYLMVSYGGSADDIYRLEVSGAEMFLPKTVAAAKEADYEVCFTPKGGSDIWLATN